MRKTGQYASGLRLGLIMKEIGMKNIELADIAGVNKSFVSSVRKGRNGVSATILAGISSAYPEVNPDWVMNGRGEKYFGKSEKNIGLPSMVAEPDATYQKTEKKEEIGLVVMDVTPLAGLLDQFREEMDALKLEVAQLRAWRARMEGDEPPEPPD